MKADPHAPADTRSMGIVHSALRRDLVRTRLVVTAATPPADERRVAIADHLLWMMDFLHHHAGEDDGLYPLVLRRNPGASALLEEMDREHQRIAPAITVLELAAHDYCATAGAGEALLSSLSGMDEVLLPHLRREEEEMMPVVSASITNAEWKDWDQRYNIKPKGLLQLADEGHWILDGLDETNRGVIVHLVPAVPRFILVRGLGGRYRRRRTALWGGTEAERVPSLLPSTVGWWSR